MITKIIKIENLGIFSGYPSVGDPDCTFKKYNVIYGMNGAGKTTLSSLLEKIADRDKENHRDKWEKYTKDVKAKILSE